MFFCINWTNLCQISRSLVKAQNLSTMRSVFFMLHIWGVCITGPIEIILQVMLRDLAFFFRMEKCKCCSFSQKKVTNSKRFAKKYQRTCYIIICLGFSGKANSFHQINPVLRKINPVLRKCRVVIFQPKSCSPKLPFRINQSCL